MIISLVLRVDVMVTRFIRGLFCCLRSDVEELVEMSDPSTDEYELVDAKPGRVLRVRHILPERPVVEEPSWYGGLVSCKRKITEYRSGQLYIENLGDKVSFELKPNVESAKEVKSPGDAQVNGKDLQPKWCRTNSKRTIIIDCERRVSSCKGTHPDVALFFIHGVGGSLDIWGSQLDFFSQLGYEVIAPDLLGHGSSSAPQIPAAYTFYALAEDMRIIFKTYAKKRNVLIGHSYGTSFCTFLAHEYPDQIHKMVLINGGGPAALKPNPIFNLPTCVLHCLSPLLSWSFLKVSFARQGSREKQLMRDNNAFNVSSLVLRAMMNGMYWPEGDEVYHAEITAPTLLVHGMHDKIVPVEEDEHMAELLLMTSLKVVEDGSHMVMMECPEVVNTLLHEFLLSEPALLQPSRHKFKVRPKTASAPSDSPKAASDGQPSTAQPASGSSF